MSEVGPNQTATVGPDQTDRATHETLTSLPIYGKGAQGKFQRTVNTALRLIAKDEPDTFQFHAATGTRDPLVTFLRTPEDNDPRGRAQGYQALTRQGHTRRRATLAGEDQLDLLQELEATENVATDDDHDVDKGD